MKLLFVSLANTNTSDSPVAIVTGTTSSIESSLYTEEGMSERDRFASLYIDVSSATSSKMAASNIYSVFMGSSTVCSYDLTV